MIYFIAFAFLISILVFVHELGHYLAARSIGVKVERFSVGFPPRLGTFTSVPGGWKVNLFFFKKNKEGKLQWLPIFNSTLKQTGKKGSGTEYCLSIIPFGGYVKVAGMIDESMDSSFDHKPYELMSKPRWKQIWFMSAGVLMNTLMAFIIYTGLAINNGAVPVSNLPIIGEVVAGAPAENNDLRPGDIIKSINGKNISSWENLVSEVYPRPNQNIKLEYIRDSRVKSINLKTSYQMNFKGDTLGVIGIRQEYRPSTFSESISIGSYRTMQGFGMIIYSIQMLTSGKAKFDQLGGPIMIGQLAGEAFEMGFSYYFGLMALISCNLAFLNILPIPGLDGGHIFITLIEGTIRRPLSLKTRMLIQQIGTVLLLMLMISVMINDIGRLFG
ncbi:MAG: M50 family metallopeptidase [Candidatus Neomarinimicrobiota bacterium]|nr:M50 family metallopeptidase [Candidatus Neomarinimicrobiota bacterium]